MIILAVASVSAFGQKKKAIVKVSSPDSVLVSKADLQSLLKNYYQKVDRAAIADKMQIEANAGNEKKAIEKYYLQMFPEPKPAPADTAKIGKPLKKQ